MAKKSKKARAAQGAPQKASSALWLVLGCLVVGGLVGWLIGDANATMPGAEIAPEGSASATVAPACQDWSGRICKEAGDQSEGCRDAKSAVRLLPGAACQQALGEVDATLAKIKEARKDCDTLVSKLCKDLGEETESCKRIRDQAPRVPSEQCTKTLENYDQMLKQFREAEKANAPLTPEMAAKQAAGDGPSFGPKDAKVTIVEYSDFQCPYCARAAKAVHKIKQRYGKVVRFVFHQYPLPSHTGSMLAAQATMAANDQGKFWEYHDLLFENQREVGREALEEYA
jgi:hypothetical protein